jgi:hypothetical protein
VGTRGSDRALLCGPSTSPLEAMRHLFAVVVGALVAVVAAWVLISPFFASHRGIDKISAAITDVTDIPLALTQRADCMYRALATIPGVYQPREGRVTSNGWTHPFLEYSATINPYLEYSGATIRTYPMRFEAQRDGRNHDEYWYWFSGSFAGPIPPGFDIAQMESIMRKWKGLCHVVAEIEVN